MIAVNMANTESCLYKHQIPQDKLEGAMFKERKSYRILLGKTVLNLERRSLEGVSSTLLINFLP